MKLLLFLMLLASRLWSGTIAYDPHKLKLVKSDGNNYPGLKDRDIKIIEVEHELEEYLVDQFNFALINNKEVKITFSGKSILINREPDLPTKFGVSQEFPHGQDIFVHHGDIKYKKKWLFVGENRIFYRVFNGWKKITINEHSLFGALVRQIQYARRVKKGVLINQQMLKEDSQPYANGQQVLKIAEPSLDEREHIVSPPRATFFEHELRDPFDVHLTADISSNEIFAYYMYQRIKQSRQNNLYIAVNENILKNAKTFEEIDQGIIITDQEINGKWESFSYKDVEVNKRAGKYRFEFCLNGNNYYIPLHYSRIKNLASSLVSYAKNEKTNLSVNLAALSKKNKQKYLHCRHLMKVNGNEIANNEDMSLFFQ